MNEAKIKKNILLLIFSIVFVMLYSYTTLYNIGSNDSSIFLTIGKFWSDGKLPYVDLFDHKGPLIFFINMLGYKMFGRSQGLFIFQVISMFFSLYFLEKIACLELKNKKKSIFFTFLTLCFLSVIYSGGNLTEEYCLPFIMVCMYLTLKFFNTYIKTKKNCHKRIYSFIYGFSLAVCFLTRLTNCISILLGISIIYFIFIKEKNIKLLLENLILLILGFLVLVLPFSIYFIFKNSFYEFLYGTLLYNMDYASKLFSWVYSGNILKYILIYFVCFFPSYIILIIGVFKFKKEKNIKSLFYILLGLFESAFFLIGNLYPHYSMITLPNFIILLCEVDNNVDKYKKVFYFFIIFCFCFWNFVYVFNVKKEFMNNDNYSKIDELISKIDDKNSFIAVNIDEYKEIYINNNIVPFYKYFVLQDWQALNSYKMRLSLINEFEKRNVKYVLIQNEKESVIYDLLLEKYIYKDSVVIDRSVINLYVLK